MSENENLCLVAVYEPLDHNVPKTRASAVVSAIPENKLVDRLVFDELDFDDDDALHEAERKIMEFVRKHQAKPLSLRGLAPRQNCPKCKNIKDVIAMMKNNQLVADLVCYKCNK
jgi:hypothetical protein